MAARYLGGTLIKKSPEIDDLSSDQVIDFVMVGATGLEPVTR
jgi:hypothetical protein